jgi:hypothetical protein
MHLDGLCHEIAGSGRELAALGRGGEALPVPEGIGDDWRREAHAPGGGPLAGRWPVRERPRRVRSRSRTREIVASAI